MESVKSQASQPQQSAKPLYTEDLNTLFQQSNGLSRPEFDVRVGRLIDVVRSSGVCGSETITNTVDPELKIQRQTLIDSLWSQRQDDSLGGMVESRLFQEMTVRKLKSDETPVPAEFFQDLGNLIIKPALANTGQHHLLDQPWTPQLLELRAKIVCMVQPISRHQHLVEQVKPMGAAYGHYVSPRLAKISPEVKKLLASLPDKDTKLSAVDGARQMIEAEEVSSEYGDVAKQVADLYLSVLSDMPQALRDLAAEDKVFAEFLSGTSSDAIVQLAKEFVSAATKGWANAINGGRL